MEEHDFKDVLNNYRYGVQKVIPSYLTGKMSDEEACTDELALVLHSRDELEWAFGMSSRLWQKYGAQVDELDRLLLAMKGAILEYIPDYAAFRQQSPRPRGHWWYYLDEIVSLPVGVPTGDERPYQPQRYWMPVMPIEATA